MMPPWQRQLLLLLIISAGILNYIDRQVIAILKPMLQQSLGWSDADYGDLTSIFQLAAALAYLFTGWLVDRIGWKWSNPLAVGSWSLAAAAHALISSFGQFALARVALGATEALGTPTAIKSIATLFNPAERSQALGWMNAANSFGAIAGPLTIPLIALAYGWRATFLTIGGLGLLWVALWLLAARGVPARSGVPAPAAEPVSWLATLRDRRNIAIIGAKMLSDQVWWLLLFWAPDFFHRMFHLDMQDFGLPLAILYAAAGLGSVLGGLGSARLIRAGMTPVAAHQRVLLVCAVVATPIALAPHAANQWLAVALLSLTLAAHQGFSANLFALTTDRVEPGRLAGVIGVMAFFGNIAGMLILQAAGWILNHGFGFSALFGYCGAAYLLAVGWIRLISGREVTRAA